VKYREYDVYFARRGQKGAGISSLKKDLDEHKDHGKPEKSGKKRCPPKLNVKWLVALQQDLRKSFTRKTKGIGGSRMGRSGRAGNM